MGVALGCLPYKYLTVVCHEPVERVAQCGNRPAWSTVELNAVAKLFALIGQIAALEPITRLLDGATTVVIRDGAGVRMTVDHALVIRGGPMAEKQARFAELDKAPRSEGVCGYCLTAECGTVDAPYASVIGSRQSTQECDGRDAAGIWGPCGLIPSA